MMRWGRREEASPSSFSSSSTKPSFMSPLSWLSKFKQMRVSSSESIKKNPTSLSVASSQYASGNGSRIHFGEQSHESKKSKDVMRTEFYNLNDKKHGREEGTLKFRKKDRGTAEERRMPKDTYKVPFETNDDDDDDCYNREKKLEKLRKKFERKAQRVLQERLLKLEKEAADHKAQSAAASAKSSSVQKDVMKLEPPRTICTPRRHSFVANSAVSSKNSNLGSLEKTDGPREEKLGFERQSLKKCEMKNARKKTKHGSSKVRIYSPRMASKVEICRIKALEDMKKEKLKMKKENERILLEETAALDSFAVVKCSFNPEEDFRGSMVEMMTELRLNQPEEMEELLACYLTLNSDEYHDLIVKVFREVWFDMNKDILGIT